MSVFNLLLALHVLCGSTALLVGPVAMGSRKGRPLHRRAGLAFASAMSAGSIAAFPLALIVHDRLLLTISVLTPFLILSGLRAIRFRRGARPGRTDAASCLLLSGFALWLFWRSTAPLDVTGLFFGAGSLVLATRQWRLLRTPRPDWLLAHITGMGGAYLATADAFLVVNLGFLPKPVIFIVPTVIGTVMISWASLRHAAPRRAAVLQS